MKVACREGLKIPPQAIEQIIIGANQDIRQVALIIYSQVSMFSGLVSASLANYCIRKSSTNDILTQSHPYFYTGIILAAGGIRADILVIYWPK